MRVLIELLHKDSSFKFCQPFSCINELFIAFLKLVPLLEFFDKLPIYIQYLLVPCCCKQCRLFAVIYREKVDFIALIILLFVVFTVSLAF